MIQSILSQREFDVPQVTVDQEALDAECNRLLSSLQQIHPHNEDKMDESTDEMNSCVLSAVYPHLLRLVNDKLQSLASTLAPA